VRAPLSRLWEVFKVFYGKKAGAVAAAAAAVLIVDRVIAAAIARGESGDATYDAAKAVAVSERDMW